MGLINVFYKAANLPRAMLWKKALETSKQKIDSIKKRKRDHRHTTYSEPCLMSEGDLFHYLNGATVKELKPCAKTVSALTKLYLNHRFNLLGSGWVQVRHGMCCHGLEGYQYEVGLPAQVDREGLWMKSRINRSNLAESQRIWSLIDYHYIPIDWQLDFKSGYHWAAETWYQDILWGHMPGVDIKVPWELARMQHLSLLAWAYALSKDGQEGFAPPQVYVREFHNQVLDFIATNPPRFGVNWKSPMDIGIRVANWLVTYDLFRAYGVEFGNEFKKRFFRSIYEHGLHIMNNLEWNETHRGNHYLSNIVGLLFASSYLPCTPETNSWLALAIQELVDEVKYQFTSDGANFEASTSYHRLSAEMVIYATALVLGLPEEKREAMQHYDDRLHKGPQKLNPAPICLYLLPEGNIYTPFPAWYFERLEKMAEFSMDITKPNGHVIQIGDNDSGRFLKLLPMFHQLRVDEAKARSVNLEGYHELLENGIFWDEDYLDHRHIVAAINGLFQRDDFTRFTGGGVLETHIIGYLAKGLRLPSYKQQKESIRAEGVSVEMGRDEEKSQTFDSPNEPKREVINPRKGGCKQYGWLSFNAYPDFGLYVYRSEHIYLAIHCGPIGQNGNGGHAHNDQLSYELCIKNHDFLVDGGSFLYTPVPEIRNEFRSTRAHNTLSVEGFEQNRWEDGLRGLFSMQNDGQYHILKCSDEYFEGKYVSHGIKHARSFKFGTNDIIVEDTMQGNLFGEINLNFAPGVEIIQISKDGVDEFTLEIKISDVYPRIILNGFSEVVITEGFFSKGYGQRLKNQLVKCHRSMSVTRTIIEMGNR